MPRWKRPNVTTTAPANADPVGELTISLAEVGHPGGALELFRTADPGRHPGVDENVGRMLVIWVLLGLPVVLLVVRDERLVVEAARTLRMRHIPRAWVEEQIVAVGIFLLAVAWPVVLLRRHWVTERLAALPRVQNQLALQAKRLRPLARWKILGYRIATGGTALLLTRAAFATAWLWAAVPAAYLLVCLFAGKFPNQRRQILGLSPR